MEAKERLYLTVDGRVVAEGDPAARWLYMPVGQDISDADAVKYGLVDGSVPKPEPEPEPVKKPVKKQRKK